METSTLPFLSTFLYITVSFRFVIRFVLINLNLSSNYSISNSWMVWCYLSSNDPKHEILSKINFLNLCHPNSKFLLNFELIFVITFFELNSLCQSMFFCFLLELVIQWYIYWILIFLLFLQLCQQKWNIFQNNGFLFYSRLCSLLLSFTSLHIGYVDDGYCLQMIDVDSDNN